MLAPRTLISCEMRLKLLIICSILQYSSSIAGVENSNRTIGHRINASIYHNLSKKRTIGGAEIGVNKAPYICSLQVSKQHRCGCAIISENWLLTACTCARYVLTDLREVDILVGTNDWQSGGTRYKMYVFIPHQQCSNIFKLEGEPQYQYDIALIRIDGKIKFDETVKPIEYSKEFIKPGTQLRMFGWESEGGVLSRRLKLLHLKSISNAECKAYHSHHNIFFRDHPSHLCAYPEKANEGICGEDFGLPLVHDNRLVGVASFTHKCAIKGVPNGFARTSLLHDWIEKIRKTLNTKK